MSLAITGATGQLGRLVIEQLKRIAPDASVIALARDPAKAADLGVTTRHFDYADKDSLAPALQGVKGLLLISSNALGERVEQHARVIEAAQQAGVAHIAYTSLLRADTTPLEIGPEHLETEKLIKASGIAYTILRNGWYTENYAMRIPGAVEHGAFVGSAGDGRISSAARVDYALAAAVVLTGDGHHHRTYELAGDTAFTLADLAAELTRQTGKPIPYTNLPEADYADALLKAGLPPHWAHVIASFDTGTLEGALFDEGRELSALLGRPTTPMPETVAQVLRNA
ncbi:SDR family oxidoreductase [Luteibacter aegosomaticola]|uniref:SDR family oxidoreductase n=1 Tax=Luteibacter aegosomaticola TaxID=2911538 RepID=UPI001FFB698C|nr:SDR family oxidoreductase [Luteibacter aegosomaticola]UPG89441.1 SDR family oxidoreductase [Luteibacter aegosomaticola]